LSAATIAEATELGWEQVVDLLAFDRRRGVVVRVDGGWRLSDEAERTFGHALRGLGDGAISVSRPRRRMNG
jgi:hypothetical protein